MAQKRMLDKKISVSEQVNNLSVHGQLLYTWMILHSDDVGLLPHSAKTIKAMVVPLIEMTVEDIGIHLEDMKKNGLLDEIEYQGEKFYRHIKFPQHQTLKKDRQPQTLLKFKPSKKPKESWKLLEKILEDIGFQMEDTAFHLDTEEKGREEKRNEVKLREENKSGASLSLAPTPSQQAKTFFENPLPTIEYLTSKGVPDDIAKRELEKFVSYWTEKNKSGTKQRWELEKTFEINRRLTTWFRNIREFNKSNESKLVRV